MMVPIIKISDDNVVWLARWERSSFLIYIVIKQIKVRSILRKYGYNYIHYICRRSIGIYIWTHEWNWKYICRYISTYMRHLSSLIVPIQSVLHIHTMNPFILIYWVVCTYTHNTLDLVLPNILTYVLSMYVSIDNNISSTTPPPKKKKKKKKKTRRENIY